MTWQPIETAPNDGTSVLLFLPDRWGGVVTIADYDLDDWSDRGGSELITATHWMPLPAPPETPASPTKEDGE
jgi:hypothetical protein